MSGRKNDGVTMTRQFATKNTRALGMTTDKGVLDRYLDAVNPGRPSVEDHLGAVETPRPIVLLDHGRYKTKLVHYEDFYYFIREDRITRLGQRSITYASKRRAMQVFEMDKIRWWRETFDLPLGSKTS
jgi:hypothetical protein